MVDWTNNNLFFENTNHLLDKSLLILMWVYKNVQI